MAICGSQNAASCTTSSLAELWKEYTQTSSDGGTTITDAELCVLASRADQYRILLRGESRSAIRFDTAAESDREEQVIASIDTLRAERSTSLNCRASQGVPLFVGALGFGLEIPPGTYPMAPAPTAETQVLAGAIFFGVIVISALYEEFFE